MLLSNGNRTFQNPVPFRTGGIYFPAYISFPSLVTGDFDGDNKLDLAATNEFSDDISVLLGKGDGTFQNQVRFGVGDSPTSLVAGYFDDDGRPERRLDLAVANSGVR